LDSTLREDPNLPVRIENQSAALFHRIGEVGRAALRLEVDGEVVEAMEGDTLLTALLANGRHVRTSEFGDGPRSGFCLMGACQDCWVWTVEGSRLRACGTPVTKGMRIVTREVPWPTCA
jgi:D-hydroxyproline dehydrogenase subunit gamma